MGIPIISEIWDGVRFIINFFFDKIPKPLQMLIFLVFLLVFGTLISFFLQIGGIHCNSNNDVVKVDILDIGTNLVLIWETRDEPFTSQNLTICQAHPEKCGRESECFFYAQERNDGYYDYCNMTSGNENCTYFLRDGLCHNCTEREICFKDAQFFFICGNWNSVCIDNAFSTGRESTDKFFGCSSACFVPENYVWNTTTGLYHCADQNRCGVNATIEADPIIDEKLLKAGAELIYPETQSKYDYRNLVKIKCNNNFNPRFTFFGIDIFDYKIWLLLIVIWVMVMFLFKLK